MADFIEKRKFHRITASLPLRYKELRGKTYLSKGTLTRDLSEGGVRFHTDKFVSLACHLVLEIKLPSIGKPMRTISKIAWIKKLPAGDRYEVGNQFLAMTDEDASLIASYAEKNVQTPQEF